MRTVFEEDEPMQQDRELTLGAGTLLLLFFALVLVCGLCFGVGYTFGLRSQRAPIAGITAPGTAPIIENKTEKPSAAPASSDSSSATNTPAASPAATPLADDLTAASETPAVAAPVTASASYPASAPAAASSPSPAAPTGPTGQAGQAPMQTPAAIMVQVAAVSDRNDAEVLLGALRKRGYPVTLAHLSSDNLMHVQVGPFSTRADAMATRQKLLSDGYNAIIR